MGNFLDVEGSYTLSGSGLLSAASEGVNYTSFTQSGGTNVVSNSLFLNSSGTYSLSGGSLSAPTETIGENGTGSFTQSGGTNTVANLILGYALPYTSASGTYNLTGGLLNLTSSAGLTIGQHSSATFDFSGGTIQLPSGFTSSVPITLNVSGGIGTFDTHGNTLTLANPLSGPGGLNKGGAGMLILATSDSYTGPTTVSSGTLELLADIPSSSFTANNGATLLFGPATFNLNFGFVGALSGGTVQYQNATLNGGFLRAGHPCFFARLHQHLQWHDDRYCARGPTKRNGRIHRRDEPWPTERQRPVDLGGWP